MNLAVFNHDLARTELAHDVQVMRGDHHSDANILKSAGTVA